MAGGESSLTGSEGFTGGLGREGIGGAVKSGGFSGGGQVKVGVGSFEMGLESRPSFVGAGELAPGVATDGETTGVGNHIASDVDEVLGGYFIVACDGEA